MNLAAFAAALVVVFLRRPETLTQAEYWADDGLFYGHALAGGSIFEPYSGYLVLGVRLLAATQALVPPAWAPLLGSLASVALVALLAAFLASERMAPLIPDGRRRLGLAAVVVLVPSAGLLFGNTANVQWIAGAWVLSLTVATGGPRWELAVIGFAMLTGPVGVLFAPLFVARWWRDRSTWPLLAVVLAGVFAQVFTLTQSARPGTVPPNIGLIPVVVLERATHLPVVPAAALLVALLSATWSLSWRRRIAFGYAAAIIPVVALTAAFAPTSAFLGEGNGPRYFWIATALMAVALLAVKPGRVTRIPFAAAVAVLLAIGIVSFRLAPLPVTGWAANSACIGGLEPCVVPVAPDARWSVVWPGLTRRGR